MLVGDGFAGWGTGDGVGEALGETEVGGTAVRYVVEVGSGRTPRLESPGEAVSSTAGVRATTSSDSTSGCARVATGAEVGGSAVASGLTTASTDFGVVLTAGVMDSSVTTVASSVSAQLTIDMRAAETTRNLANSPLYLCLCER